MEKLRDYKLVAKVIAICILGSLGLSLLIELIRVINNPLGSISGMVLFRTILSNSPQIIIAIVFLFGKHHDKIFSYLFVGALAVVNLVGISSLVDMFRLTFFWSDSTMMLQKDIGFLILMRIVELLFSAVIAVYYLGLVKPRGRNFFLVIFYGMMIVNVLISFAFGFVMPMGMLPIYMVFVMYDYSERRCPNSKIVYIGLIGLAYYLLYYCLTCVALGGLARSALLNILDLIACLLVPLLIYDREVPGEEKAMKIAFLDALYESSTQAQQPVQPVQQGGFDPMTGQPVQPVQQGGFDPMTGQPLNNGDNNIPQ